MTEYKESIMGEANDFSRPFAGIAGSLLGLVGLLHLLRVAAGWSIVIEGWEMPFWLSGTAGVALVGLATMLWREARRR